ncbi:MAG TPA: ArsR family transcriptional regulator, partial [Dehalococcoidia bacterium]|nr:ArsR family transcriptional regulator [Dehalococcoidia bacterium]
MHIYALTDIYPHRNIAPVPVSAFEVLAEPSRRRILDLLQRAERPVGELVEELSLSQP